MLRLPPILQDADHRCADAAAECVLRYHRFRVPVRIATKQDGADPRLVENYLRSLGLSVLSGEMDLTDLGYFVRSRRPVICLVQWPGESSHYVVVGGVTRRSVYIHDVATGPKRVPMVEWLEAWAADDARHSRPFRRWGIAAWPG